MTRAPSSRWHAVSFGEGGINTRHWPMGNFAKDCGSPCGDNHNMGGLDPVALVATNMPIYDGRNAGAVFDALVDALAAFLADLRSADGEREAF